MTFQEFLQFKTAQAIVEHVETLSDAEAREFVDQLDESTVELIEALLNEISLKKTERVARSLEKKIAGETNDIKRAKLKDRLDAARKVQDAKLALRAKRVVANRATDDEGHVTGTPSTKRGDVDETGYTASIGGPRPDPATANLMGAVARQDRKNPLMQRAARYVTARKELERKYS